MAYKRQTWRPTEEQKELRRKVRQRRAYLRRQARLAYLRKITASNKEPLT